MRPALQGEILEAYEKLIYLPMLLTVFEKDKVNVARLDFKLKAPYLELIDRAMKCAARDLRETRIYMTKNNYKMYKGEQTAEFTEYVFYYLGYQDQRKYLNLRLRNRTEELMRLYLAEGSRLLE